MCVFVGGTSICLKRHTILAMTTELWFKDIVSSRIHSHHFGSIHSPCQLLSLCTQPLNKQLD